MSWKKLESTAEIIILTIAFLLTNKGVWLCLFDINDPLSFCSYGYAGSEFPLLFLICCLAVGILWRKGALGKLISAEWANNKLLAAFIFLAIISASWTVELTGTIYHILMLVFSTALAFFWGTNFSSNRWSGILLWFSGIIVISSYILLIFFPNAAIMAEPHLGSWRGIFWHKNFTGSFMALVNALFLNLIISSSRNQKGRILTGISLYIMSLIFTIYSLSAGGIVTLLALNSIQLALFLWSKFKKHLTTRHYYIMGAMIVVVILIFVINMNVFFGLMNRSSNLTGRIPLWNYLIKSTVLQRPILGHGFGAIWVDSKFQEAVTISRGWSFQITNGHSGFMDTLLNLGFVGFFLLIIIFFLAFLRSAKYFINDSKSENLLPFLVLLYVFLANLSVSFVLEIESFHWMLLTSVLFFINHRNGVS